MSSHILNDTYLRSLSIDLSSDQADLHISDTHKIWHLKNHIDLPTNCHMLLTVSAFSMGYTFYQFRENINNKFTVETYDGITTLSQEITIDEGNYDMRTICQHLNTKFTIVKGSLGLTTMSINFNKSSNKFYMTCLPVMNTITIKNNLAWKELGFDNADYIYSSVSHMPFPYTFNMGGDQLLFCRILNSDIHNINSLNYDGILCTIPCEYSFGQIIYYKPNELQYFKTYNFTPQNIEISILDASMKDINNLNTKSPWHISLSIHFSYNKEIRTPNIYNI